MNGGCSYSTYINWDIWVPIGVIILTFILTAVLVILSIISFKCYRSSAHHLIELTYQFAKLVLWDSLKRDSAPPHLTLYDRKVSPIFVALLSTLTPALFIPAFVSFWGLFLVDETYSCDPGLDCFLRDPSSFEIVDKQPLSNCTDVDNDTVVCFQFVFDYTAGIAATGGFLVVAATLLRVYGILLVWLVGVMPSSYGRTNGRCHPCKILCSIVIVFVFFLTPIIIAATTLIVVLLYRFINDIVFQSNEGILKFATYWSSLVYCGLVVGVCTLVVVIGNSTSSNRYDTSSDMEARFSASFDMTANRPQQLESATINSTGKSQPQPLKDEPETPELGPPPLVGSVLSSYHDVTSLPPRHSESSFLLSAGAKSADYKTT